MPTTLPLCPRNLLTVLFTALLTVLLSACSAISEALPQAGIGVAVGLPGAGTQAPLEDAVIYGDVSITVQSESAVGANLYLDQTAEPLASSSSFPATFTFDTQALSDGPHTLTLDLLTLDGDTRLELIPFWVGNEAFAMLGAVNALRVQGHDCDSKGVYAPAPALRLESRLMEAALRQASDMNASGVMTHTGSDGSTVATRVSNTGYRWSRVGENLASGQKTVEEVVGAWAESDGHCANLLDPDFRELGVGHAGTFWAQAFAQPR